MGGWVGGWVGGEVTLREGLDEGVDVGGFRCSDHVRVGVGVGLEPVGDVFSEGDGEERGFLREHSDLVGELFLGEGGEIAPVWIV